MKGPIMLLALVAGVFAGPINVRYNEPNVCSTTCTESSKFKYEPGTTYVFDYNVQTETSMEGASEDKAVMGIKATAHVEVMSKCDMALRLSDVKLFPRSNSQFANSLEDQALRFSFQDGRIEDLCPVDGEPHWVLNVKRGILSTFQNSMDNLEVDQTIHETDVTGKCPAEYKLISKGWYTTAIKKTKNLLGCMDRHGWRSAVQASPYRIPSELQSLPLMKSEHVCDQEIGKGYVKSTVCKETHVFRPFSHYNNGSSTKVLQKLTFNRQIKQTTLRPNTVNSRTTMLFTHSEDHTSTKQNQRLVEAKLADLCTKSKDDIRPEVPEIFAEMIFLMRGLDATALRNIYRQAERGAICRDNIEKTKKFFLDAIPMVSTSGSVQLLKELLISKAVNGTEADMWLTSLALIQSPTREMIVEVKAILNMKELEQKAMLPITSLVNNYCSKNTKCSEEYEVTGIISTLERNLGYGCYAGDENLEKVLLTLRAIGNAGHSENVGSAVSNCFTRQSNPAEVRVTALDAFRRLPCSVDRSEPLSILRDTDEDSEVRIAAYLAIMKCPSEDLIKDVRTILEAEEANQVSSFIWSHLTNLMETSSPHKQSIRDIVEDQRLKKSFDLESIKYSRNYEGSFMLESLNTGAVAESNVIWSSKSFIPRSAMVNLTVDLFGSSVNLFELGGRVEGLEYLIETYLGPFGYFGEKSSKDIAKSREQLDKLRASMYMRMFGNEMSFSHFKGIKEFNIDKFNYLDFLIKISKEHDYSYSQSMMFLDSSVIIPTTSGLPLNLTVTGVSSMDLKASGSVDLKKIATNPRSLNIDGTIKPSGAVTITGAMTVDAYVTKTGLKMTSTLHSSTAVTGRIRLERGKILEVVFDLPQDKMEVLDIKSRFFNINGEEEREQAMITENRKEKTFCTGSKLAEIVGLELCGEMKFPNASLQDAAPYFPFTGPTTMSLVLHKRDTHAGYKLLAKRLETKEQSIAQIAFDTPGSTKVKRAIAMDVVLNFPNKHLEVSTTTPWTEMLLKGKVINEETKKAFIGSFEKDGERYAINSIVDVENKGPVTKLSPRIEIVRPRLPRIILAGSMDIEGTKRFSTDLSLVNAIDHPISVKGSIVDTKWEKSIEGRLQFDESGEYIISTSLLKESRKTSMKITPTFEIRTPKEHVAKIDGNMDYKQGKYLKGDITATIKELLPKPVEIKFKNIMKEDKKMNQRYELNVLLGSKWLTGKFDGNMVKSKKGQTTARLSVDYKLHKGKKNKFIVSGKFNDKCTKSIYKYILNANMDVKKNPEYNWVVNLDMSHNKKHSDASAIIKYGKNLKDKSKQIELSSTLNRKGSLGAASIDYKISSKIPYLDVDVSANGNHKHDRKYLKNNMLVNYGKDKSVKSAVELYDRSKKFINMGGMVDLKYPEHQLNLDTDFDQNKDQYIHKLNFKMDKKKSSITTTYTNPNSKKHEVASEIFLDSFKPVTLAGMVNLDLNKFKSSGELIQGNNKYGFIASKASKDMYNHVVGADVYYPGREISTDITTGAYNNKYTGRILTNWDKNDKSSRALLDTSMAFKSLADMDGSIKLVYPDKTITLNAKHQGKDKVMTHVDVAWSPEEKIDLDFTLSHANNYRNRNIGTSLVLTTPFRMVPKITTELTYNNDYNGIKTTSLVSWGRDQITSNAFIKKPISASGFEAEASVTTPFTGFRRMSSDINHRVTDKVYTTLKGSLEDKHAEVSLKAGLKGDPRNEIGMDASLNLKSNIRNMESMSAQITHIHDLQKFTTDIVLAHNDDKYIYDLDMSVNNGQRTFTTVGKLMLVSPYYRGTTNWNHLHSAADGSIKSTVNSDWGRGRKFYIDLSGSHENLRTRKIDGSLAIQTPWEALPEVELNLKHEFGRGIWNYMGNMKTERQVVGSSSFNYRRGAQLVTFDVSVTTPYSEDLTGALSISTQMPYTGRIETQWATGRKINIDGTVSGDFPSNIEGSIKLTTPFRALRSVFATASNKKEGDEWITSSTVEYGLRKTIQLETRLGLSYNKKVRVQLFTPYDILRRIDSGIEFNAGTYELNGRADFEVEPVIGKFSALINANWEKDMGAKARLETPFRVFPYAQFDASSSKDSKGRHSQLEIEYSPRQIITLDNHYNFNGPIIFDIKMKTPFTNLEVVGANIRHSGSSGSFQTDAEVTYAPYKTILGNLRMNMMRNGIDGNLKVTTPFPGYKTGSATFRHSGLWTDFTTYGSIEAHNQKYDADIRLQHGESTSTSITVHTPFSQYEETKYTMEKKGDLYNLDFTTSFLYGAKEQFSLALGNKASRGILKTDVTVMNPFTVPFKFNIDHYGLITNFQTKVSSSFGRDNMIDSTTKVTIRLPKIDISSDADYRLLGEGRKVGVMINKEGEWMDMSGKIEATCDTHKASLVGNFKFLQKIMGGLAFTTTSFGNKDISMSFSQEGPLQEFQSEGNVKYLDTEMSGKLNWYNDGLKRINSVAELSTPFAGFEQMSYDYQHAVDGQSFTGKGKVSYGYNDIIGDAAFTMEPAVTGSVTLKTPFKDYRNNRLAFKGEGSMTDFKIHGEGELFGERLDIDSNLSHDSIFKTGGLFNMKATSRKIRDVSLNFNNRGSMGSFAATGAVNYAGDKIMEGSITSVHQPSKTAYTLKLQCMFMNTVDASFEHTGTPVSDCHTKLSASLGNLISGTYNSDMAINGNNADIHLDGAYKYYDLKNKASLNLKKEGEWSNGKMSADAKIDDKDASASATYNIRRNFVQVGAIVNTPFDGFRDLAANLDYANRRQRVVTASVRYMDGQEVSSDMKLLNDGWKDVTAEATVNTPFNGYEQTTVRYNHVLDDTSLNSGITTQYGRNMEISTKLAIESDEENKFAVEVTTPFKGYRDTKFSAKMNKNRSRPSAAISLKNGRSTVYDLQGEMDLVSTPMNGGLYITTPHNEYRKADVTFTHSGEWSDFRSTVNVNSQLTGAMEGDVSFVYISPKSLDTSVAFKSEFANFEDLSFSAKNTPNRDGLDTTIVAEWAPEKKIEFDSSYNRHNGWSSVEHVGTMSVSTPFEVLKSAMIKNSVEQAGDRYTKKLTISHNDDELVDVTGTANLGDIKDITLDIVSPMQVVVKGSVTPNGGRFDTDKDFEIKLIHAVRTMGLSGTVQSSKGVLKSKGALLWNENKGQRFAYDFDMSSIKRKRKQMMDSTLKIELPTRTLAFTGVINNDSYEKSIDGSVMWDAANDQSKKVAVKATITPGSKTNKMEVILNLPTIQRKIRIGSEMTLDNGKVIFDGKTEFSYSSDSRKTLVLTSNLKDVSFDSVLKNYTMSVGIRHLYTNTDLFLVSHLGQSADKLSTGMSMDYLTASRQRMNMMLLGEIDQLRRRINVDVISPMKRVKVVGEVDSIKPFHVSIQNEINNEPGMSAELAVDCEKKTFDFQAKYDPSDLSNTLYIEGRYPNRSAIRAEAYTMKQGRRISESVMGIRLNTSRIIHTKVTWRPQISQEIQALASKGYRSMMEEMMVVNNKVSEELASKYSKIADATAEELMPFIKMMEEELANLGKDLKIVVQESRRMYERNDLFIRDMGEYVQGIYLQTEAGLGRFIEQYKTMTASMIQDLNKLVQTIQHYPITEEYYKLINTIKMYPLAQMEKMSAYLDVVIADLTEKTQMYSDKYSQHIVELTTRISNHHSVQGLKRKIAELQKINYSKYISDLTNTVGEQVGKLNLPERYNAAITNVHSVINDNLDSIMRRQEMKYLHSAGNEVYQQGKWAYGYWRVEENVRNQLHQIVELVKELLTAEYTKYSQIFRGPRVNVTVYDPVQGEFQADVYLTFPLETLDETPRITNYIHDAKDVMTNYLPSKDTVVQMYNNYFPGSNNTDSEFKQELNEYIKSIPKRRMRNLNRRKNKRRSRN